MGPALLGVAGVWLLCQVLGGNALGRLGIAGTAEAAPSVGGGVPLGGGVTPGPGVPMPGVN